MDLKIIHFKLLPHLPGVNELTVNNKYFREHQSYYNVAATYLVRERCFDDAEKQNLP